MPSPDLALSEILAQPKLRSLISHFGIERTALLTELDTSDVQVVSVVCPDSDDVIKTYTGRGLSLRQAATGAIMECVERTSARWRKKDLRIGSVVDLKSDGVSYYGPPAFTESKHSTWTERAEIPWVQCFSLRFARACWVPADLVFWGLNRPSAAPAFEVTTTNGLAAHFYMDQAVRKGLREVIERHVISEVELATGDRALAALIGMAERLGIDAREIAAHYRYDPRQLKEYRPRDSALARIVESFKTSGIDVRVKLLGECHGLYVVGCASAELAYDGNYIGCAGYGVQDDLEAAAQDAVFEMCQSRIVDLHGVREDCGIDDKARVRPTAPAHWLLDSTAGEIAAFEQRQTQDWFGIALQAFPDVLLYKFLNDDSSLCAVRVVVPGAQTWHITAGQSDFNKAS